MMKLPELDKYDYLLPEELLATSPVHPPEAARLFVYDTQTDEIIFSTFADIAKFLPKQSLLVRNVTRVVPAKISLVMGNEAFDAIVLANEAFDGECFRALVTGTHVPGDQARLGDADIEFIRLDGAAWFLRCSQVHDAASLVEVLEREGTTPLPPYISKRSRLSESEAAAAYQSPFAQEGVSVASPTASLHFSQPVIDSLEQAGHIFTNVLLNVGRGTFAPLLPEMLEAKKLHLEEYKIPKQTAVAVDAARAAGTPVVAIGTTATRALESRAARGEDAGWTDLFIQPPYDFKAVDVMITNFHVPRTSLVAMVEAFLQNKGSKRGIIDLYKVAIEEKFRFFSFGDGMLIK